MLKVEPGIQWDGLHPRLTRSQRIHIARNKQGGRHWSFGVQPPDILAGEQHLGLEAINPEADGDNQDAPPVHEYAGPITRLRSQQLLQGAVYRSTLPLQGCAKNNMTVNRLLMATPSTPPQPLVNTDIIDGSKFKAARVRPSPQAYLFGNIQGGVYRRYSAPIVSTGSIQV